MITNERMALVGTTALAGVLTGTQAIRGVEAVDGLWAPSWWLAAGGCLLGVATALCPRPASSRRHRWLMWAGLAAAVLVLFPALMRAPWTLLMAIIWLGGKITNGPAHFDLQPDWFGSGVLVTALLAGGAVLLQAREDRRLGRQRCRRCGRSGPAPAPLRRGLLRGAAALAVVAPLPYAALKLAWGLGSDTGLRDPHLFDDVSFWSPGFGDTSILSAVAIVAAVAMAVPVRRQAARIVLGIVGSVGSVMLVPVGAMAVVGFTRVALGLDSLYDEGLHAWVFVLVYVSFMVWGAGLSVLTATYLAGTRPPCDDHLSAVPGSPVRGATSPARGTTGQANSTRLDA